MPNRLIPLTTIDELDAALAASATRPLLIFKHSVTCGTSAAAAEEMDDLMTGTPIEADICVVRIQAARAVSGEIERRLRVRHESPQVLLIRDGHVVWSVTHFRISAPAVLKALEETSGPPLIA